MVSTIRAKWLGYYMAEKENQKKIQKLKTSILNKKVNSGNSVLRLKNEETLEKEDEMRLQTALQNSRAAVAVLLASPWALPQNVHTQATLFTFSPAPEFQQTAAEILLGNRTANGKLPVSR